MTTKAGAVREPEAVEQLRKYGDQEVATYIDELAARLAAVEADNRHIRQANENYRRENQLAVERATQAESALRDARNAALEEAVKCRDVVPILPGEMPDAMWESIRNDRDACAQAMRIAVRQTLDEYEQTIRNLPPPPTRRSEHE